ncbi:MAG: GNAT family N-acetyltransferase [Pirellulales bacterium]|nr:GNAT family N-acetyltransferase [Pirellulales bacterium]
MEPIELRTMTPADRGEVAELICVSVNAWYQSRGRPAIFTGGPGTTAVFFDVYEALDPGCGLVAVNAETGRLAGSCFFHPRPTHVSLGIMNVHPNYFGRGVARLLLNRIIEHAERLELPLRLVSSAMNLDSFSLYSRAGFAPFAAYQDMLLTVPAEGIFPPPPCAGRVRTATLDDVPAVAALEMEIAGIRREQDFRHFLENREGFWHLSVCRGAAGGLDGFMASSGHPGCNMIGPGAARTPDAALALLAAEFDRHRGRSPVALIPVSSRPLVAQMYAWGAKNCETHFAQVRGAAPPLAGLHFPTFLPETS